jgi:hypothetical protein
MEIAALAQLVLSVIVPQSDPRELLAGRVLDAAGAPVAGARVTLVHRPVALAREYGKLDHRESTTDERGRFRVEVLRGRPYSAFASWGGPEAPVVSACMENAVGGSSPTLREQAAAIVPLRVAIHGLDAWEELGPFGFRAVPYTVQPWTVPLFRAEDGSLLLPPLPGTGCTLEVLTREGEVLFGAWLTHGRQARVGIENREPGSSAGLQLLHVPPPLAIPLEVVAAGAGTPIAGAEIRVRSNWYAHSLPTWASMRALTTSDAWRRVGISDAEGRATVRVPVEGRLQERGSKAHCCFWISSPGRANAFAGWTNGHAYRDSEFLEHDAWPVRVGLHEAEPVRGRVTLDGRTPLTFAPVLLFGDVRVRDREGHTYWNAPLAVARTDEQGRFRFEDFGLGRSPLRIAIPTDEDGVRRQLAPPGAALPTFLTPFLQAGVLSADGQEPIPRDLGEAVLGAKEPLRIEVTDQRGSPVRGATVHLVPARFADSGTAAQSAMTGGDGRCTQFAIDGEATLMAIHPEIGFALLSVGERRELSMPLEPFAVLEGQVLDAERQPVAGALVYDAGTIRSRGGGTHSLRSLLGESLMRTRTDAEGRFRLRYVPDPERICALVVIGFARAGMTPRARLEFDCSPGASREPLEVVLGQ